MNRNGHIYHFSLKHLIKLCIYFYFIIIIFLTSAYVYTFTIHKTVLLPYYWNNRFFSQRVFDKIYSNSHMHSKPHDKTLKITYLRRKLDKISFKRSTFSFIFVFTTFLFFFTRTCKYEKRILIGVVHIHPRFPNYFILLKKHIDFAANVR